MVIQKYDIAKTFKLSAQNIVSLSEIEQEKGFKSDSEAIRFCINFTKGGSNELFYAYLAFKFNPCGVTFKGS